MENEAVPENAEIGATVAAWIGGLELGPATQAGPLEIVPVLWSGANGVPSLLAHRALADGGLEIVEKNGGVVQELLALSKSPVPILILEGETLLGAKQNRMVAHTVVVGPGTRVVIPVGCMERGRWHMRSAKFSSGVGSSAWYMKRDAKQDVMEARFDGMAPSLKQSRLWSQVEDELQRESVISPSSDYHTVMEARSSDAAACVQGIRALPGQVGVMAVRDGALVGLELVGHPETWGQMSDRVLTSLLPAAYDESPSRGRRGGRDWMSAVRDAAERLKARPAVGLGRDVEIEDGGLIGSGVWMGDRFAHLSVYARA
jgi:ARG/rhodanese/phosphatase superfamily protein